MHVFPSYSNTRKVTMIMLRRSNSNTNQKRKEIMKAIGGERHVTGNQPRGKKSNQTLSSHVNPSENFIPWNCLLSAPFLLVLFLAQFEIRWQMRNNEYLFLLPIHLEDKCQDGRCVQ